MEVALGPGSCMTLQKSYRSGQFLYSSGWEQAFGYKSRDKESLDMAGYLDSVTLDLFTTLTHLSKVNTF